ncbi:hypothetical protein OS175_07350 [Marinicella sp. S1101]|uniref:hypothetical protein n=1 Tax=Marinicella marina TaxID=2996016 RepID=UPI002260D651|nr:hypothetical protein [Marinicella marina]MCX7553690.1 hypothetical protein [Marinicella marina]MDJ1140780.1 hypothetical protein [Marinicella marina]
MNETSIILKLNGLINLIIGALLVFMPSQVIDFLSTTKQVPEVVVLLLGMALNLIGMLLLWCGNRDHLSPSLIKAFILLDLIWVIFVFALIFSQTWITSTVGTTTTGLIAIVVGRLGWLLWHNHKAPAKSVSQ